MKTALLPALLAAAALAACAQTPPRVKSVAAVTVVPPDRNLEAARSYSVSPALEAIRPTPTSSAPAPLGRVNGSASLDWTLHEVA